MSKRVLSLLFAAALLLTVFPALPTSVSAEFENTYVNTGNQAEDLIGVAMTQVGYTEGPNNDTKYGQWLGYPNLPWCASFISWCAEQADISPRILARTALANPGSDPGFGVDCYHGKDYDPKRGDLFFKEDFSHVGIVYGVEGDEVLTIEANTNDDGSEEGYAVLLRRRKIEECWFGVPDYKGVDAPHTYVRKNDPGHPHPAYYECTTCGDIYYTGTPTHVLTCRSCLDCGCVTRREGYYKVVTDGGRLVVYDEEAPRKSKEWSSRKGYLENGELVYVVAGGWNWAHIIYANSVGYIRMASLEKFVPVPTGVTADREKYYHGDDATIRWNSVHTATDYQLTLLRDGVEVLSTNTAGATEYTAEDLECGRYEALVTATDGTVVSEAAGFDFRVLETYEVTFEALGGEGGPVRQVKYSDLDMTLARAEPSREGYRFLGWSENMRANYASYFPGDAWEQNGNKLLFAVWQSEDATPVQLEMQSAPDKRIFPVGQTPDTTGLELMVVYSDGTIALKKDGFTLSGYNYTKAGVYQVEIACEGLSISYEMCALACPVLFESSGWTLTMADID